MAENNQKTVYDLRLHESTIVKYQHDREPVRVIRVPGGWIYHFEKTSTFVPYHEEEYSDAGGD